MSAKTVDHLTLGTLFNLFNLRSLYTLGFSFVFGMSLWVTFIGGVISYKALPRHQFGQLQQRIFPMYFKLHTLTSFGLLLGWVLNHKTVITHIVHPTVPDVSQAYALLLAAVFQALNTFWFGPVTNKVLSRRYKLEKAEGKDPHDADASTEMKTLNTKFARVHGYSSLANMVAFLALVYHGLWIANYGITA